MYLEKFIFLIYRGQDHHSLSGSMNENSEDNLSEEEANRNAKFHITLWRTARVTTTVTVRTTNTDTTLSFDIACRVAGQMLPRFSCIIAAPAPAEGGIFFKR